jgi:iron complex outermembrane receptor protein
MRSSQLSGAGNKYELPWWISLRAALGALPHRLACVGCLIAIVTLAGDAQSQTPGTDLTNLDLEHLMNLEVTSASKREEKLFRTAAAIFLITQDDIRRSGATTIAEVLRSVPGFQVARIHVGRWAINPRGLDERSPNKLLVLIDGRSVYTPTFSGVYWDVQDTLLEDVERIEVIRGPGGTLWGSNAVNGVINIITKNSRNTQGALVSAGGGSEERGFGGARYGGAVGDNFTYRAYSRYFTRPNFVRTSGRTEPGGWSLSRGGFRTDWDVSASDSLTMQGDFYSGNSRRSSRKQLVSFSTPFTERFNDTTDISGVNVLGRWSRAFSLQSKMEVQFYYDDAERKDGDQDATSRGEDAHTVDLSVQHRMPIGSRQDLVWGGGFRHVYERINNIFESSFDPKDEATHLFNLFGQDEIMLARDRVRLTLGLKLEHNDYTGFEWQPTTRILWEPSSRHTLWGAVSRAVHPPSRSDRSETAVNDAFRDENRNAVAVIDFGNRNVQSEDLLAYEVGYRVQPTARLFVDSTVFYNDYSNLVTRLPGETYFEPLPVPHFVIPRPLQNNMRGETYGFEVYSGLQATRWWSLTAAYSRLRVQLHLLDPTIQDTAPEVQEGNSPGHHLQLHSDFKLWRRVELNSTLYYVGAALSDRPVPSYSRFDMRLAWRPVERLELSADAQNLLPKDHAEFGGSDPWLIRRSIYGKMTWQF